MTHYSFAYATENINTLESIVEKQFDGSYKLLKESIQEFENRLELDFKSTALIKDLECKNKRCVADFLSIPLVLEIIAHYYFYQESYKLIQQRNLLHESDQMKDSLLQMAVLERCREDRELFLWAIRIILPTFDIYYKSELETIKLKRTEKSIIKNLFVTCISSGMQQSTEIYNYHILVKDLIKNSQKEYLEIFTPPFFIQQGTVLSRAENKCRRMLRLEELCLLWKITDDMIAESAKGGRGGVKKYLYGKAKEDSAYKVLFTSMQSRNNSNSVSLQGIFNGDWRDLKDKAALRLKSKHSSETHN
ncbi:hypothetical protein [Acinetobacter baumannii]|uniref:hypothetical protein n=1 Tax=Acinetobacter baumannii TaxID=470 RepID=UPI001CA9006D|nr:hypothetical protein [Acinetobacter baumannii]UAB19129.1 hypothetical protein H2785_13570 [Acinetobacter baumannii]UAB22572.1 hypothetical protein H2784_13535 [Acinetobacter baumannii]